ncbi:RNA polymerase sigma factor [Planctomycetaceae bacterium SH139]
MSIACEVDLSRCTVVELVQAAQAGDREAFGELFERYRGTVLALARQRLRDQDEAEELAQEVFIKAMEKLEQLRVPEAFGGWLRRIVHRMAINRGLRQSQAVACDPVTLEATCLIEDCPQGAVVSREEAAQLRVGLSKLGVMDRRTLEAFYLHGQSLAEMSIVFEAPLGTIKRRLHVARKRLAKEMDVIQAV